MPDPTRYSFPPVTARATLSRRRSVRDGAPVDGGRPGRDLGTPRRSELGKDVLDVRARRLRRDAERFGDLRVGEALRDEARHVELTRRQRAPRLVDRDAAPGLTKELVGAGEQARAVESRGRLADLGGDRHCRCEAAPPDMGGREVQAGPLAFPDTSVPFPA